MDFNTNIDKRISFDKWMKEAHRAGEHWWCYAEFVDDNPDSAKAAYNAGADPYEYIKEEGERLDLNKFGKGWGSSW